MNTEKLKQKALAATPGPWVANQETCSLGEVCSVNQGGQPWFEICSADLFHDANNANDAAYIAAANPSTILALIAERDELLVALKDARRELAYAGRQEAHDAANAAIAKVEG